MGNEVRRYRVKILTPVHIGTGDELQANLDFYVKNDQVRVLDFDRLMAACERVGIDPMPDVEDGRLDRLFNPISSRQPKRDIDPRWAKLAALQIKNQTDKQLAPDDGLAYKARIRSVNRPETILSQIKTASSLGYIPGSSVKGAIRTVLARQLMRDKAMNMCVTKQLRAQGHSARQRRAGQEMEKRLFGRDPNRDLGRVIQVADVGPGARVQVIEVLIADINGSHQLRWKNLRNHRIVDDPKQGTSIFCECLPVGAELLTEIRIDRWLLRDRYRSLGFQAHRDRILQFEALCRTQAEVHLKREARFFRKGGMDELATFCEDQLLPLTKTNSGFVLRVGWGTGWEDKTSGDTLDTVTKEKLRRWYKLGKIVHKGCGGDVNWGSYSCKRCGRNRLAKNQIDLVSPFPKTRKIAFENQSPAYPMGWLAFEAIP